MVTRYDVQIGALLSTGAARRALGKRSVVQVYRLLMEGGISRDALDYGPNATAPPDPGHRRLGRLSFARLGRGNPRGGAGRHHGEPVGPGSSPTAVTGPFKVVAAHAQYSERLLSAASTGEIRRRLALAVCDAYGLAGWVALDVSRRRAARDHFQRSLLFGWAAQDEVAVMGAIQSVGRMDLHEAPDLALTVFQLAQLNGSSVITQAFLKADEGWAGALLGQTEEAGYAIRRAKAMFADPDSARPSWMDPAQALSDLLSVTGAAQLQLGNLAEAVADLSRALAGRPEAATRSRATDGAALATAYLRTGEIELGLSMGPRAVDAARQIPSARVRAGLARLQPELVG